VRPLGGGDGAMAKSTVGSIAANASERTVDVVQDLFVFQSQHALAVVLLSAVGLTLEQELIALYIQVHPTAV